MLWAQRYRLKTYGKPHTSIGSGAHIKAKTRRLRGESGKGPKRKIRSAGFRKDLKRTLDNRGWEQNALPENRGSMALKRRSAGSRNSIYLCCREMGKNHKSWSPCADPDTV